MSPAGRRGSSRFPGWRYAAVCALCVVGVLVPAAAHATFPGRNGVVAFERLRDTTVDPGFCSTVDCIEERVLAVAPRTRRVFDVGLCRGRECHDGSPSWSPLGGALVFNRRIEDREGEIPTRYALAIGHRGGSHVRLVHEPGGDPAWSPSGREVVFQSLIDRNRALYTLNLTTGATQRLVRGYAADWSNRGLIALSRTTGGSRRVRSDIFTIRPNRPATLRRLTRDGRSDEGSWSPHATKVAFTRFGGRDPAIYVMNADGKKKRRVVNNGTSPVWSPDGRKIAFVRRNRIYVSNSDGSRQRRIYTARETGLAVPIGTPTWQARSQRR